MPLGPDRVMRARAAVLPLALLAILLAAVAANDGLRSLLATALAHVRLAAVLATVPCQIAATLLCAAALAALRPGPGFLACLGSRLLRDGGGNLLVIAPGLGEAIGARALVLSGGRTRAALSASALDTLAETLAQLPFIALAFWVLPRFWDKARLPALPIGHATLALASIVVLLLAIVAFACWWRSNSRSARWARAEWAHLRVELSGQRGGMPASIALHFAAWFMGGVQLWMAAHAMSLPITLFAALAVDSVAYAARGILFFVPAGLVLQEAGLIGAGLAFGIPAGPALALALVLRLRDMLFGTALALWPVLEWRRAAAAARNP
ncbi:MAG: flippase-like domain-containing protein [Sphingomonadales bacterium]|nr:flippase-like domain-containing protein [Sphingomonadales bacterium]